MNTFSFNEFFFSCRASGTIQKKSPLFAQDLRPGLLSFFPAGYCVIYSSDEISIRRSGDLSFNLPNKIEYWLIAISPDEKVIKCS